MNRRYGVIHSSAIVSPNAKIGKNVQIGPNSIIYDNVIIGEKTIVDGFCEIGYPTTLAKGVPLTISDNSHIRSHSIFYEGSTFKEGLVTGHRVTVRENTKAGINLQIGTLCDFQGDCQIGDYVRTHSNVHIGKNSNIGNFVWIFPYVVLTNDPHPPSNFLSGVTINDYAVIATKAVILPGVTIGKNSLVGALALVRQDVAALAVVVGNPAKKITTVDKIKSQFTGEPVYPWRDHFERGMPWEGVGYQAWISKMSHLEKSSRRK